MAAAGGPRGRQTTLSLRTVTEGADESWGQRYHSLPVHPRAGERLGERGSLLQTAALCGREPPAGGRPLREVGLTILLALVLQVTPRKATSAKQQVEMLRHVAGRMQEVDEEVSSLPQGARTYESVGRM